MIGREDKDNPNSIELAGLAQVWLRFAPRRGSVHPDLRYESQILAPHPLPSAFAFLADQTAEQIKTKPIIHHLAITAKIGLCMNIAPRHTLLAQIDGRWVN